MTAALMNAVMTNGFYCNNFVEQTNNTGITLCLLPPASNFSVALGIGWNPGPGQFLKEVDFYVNGSKYICPSSTCSLGLPNATLFASGYAVVKDTSNNQYPTGPFQAYLVNDLLLRPQCNRCEMASAGGPVGPFTGELWYDHTDFSMASPFGLRFERFYDNQSAYTNDLGTGWRHTWDANVDISTVAQGYVVYHDNQNKPEYFAVKAGQSQYDNFSGDTLTLNVSGSYTLMRWHGETDTFDASGNLTQLTDRVGNTQTILRDSASGHNDRVIEATDVLGRSLCFYYDTSNRIVGLVNWFSIAACPTTQPSATLSMFFTYDGSNNLATVKEPDGHTWTYTYATTTSYPHNLLSVKDPSGNYEEINTYTNNKVATQWTGSQSANPKPNFLQFTYSTNQATVLDGDSRTSTFTFNANGSLSQVSGPLCGCGGGQAQSFTYDQFLRALSSTDGDGSTHTITYTYGRDVTEPAGSGTNIDVAYPGPTQIVEPIATGLTRTSNVTYYPGGDPRQDLANVITLPSADTTGNLLTVTDTYSTTGLLTSEAQQGYINAVSTTYTTSYGYDSRGRLQTATGPRTDLVQKWVLGYYADTDGDFARRGQLQTITDPLNHLTNVAGDVSPYNTYSVFGQPLSVTDPNGVITDFSFDGLGRLTKRTIKGVTGDTAPLTISYNYTVAGLLSQLTSPIGYKVKLGYDSSNRLLTADRVDTANLEHERYQIDYDAMSQPTDELARACAAPSANCTTWTTTQQENFKFDTYGRLSEIDHPLPTGAKIVFGYDGAGNLTTIQDENHTNANATYGYDLANRLISLTQTLAGAPGGQILTQYGYDVLDDLNSVIDSNTNQTTYAFDDFGRVRTQNSPVSGVLTFGYDANGNVTSYTDANTASTSATYDALDRVLSAVSTRTGSTTEQVSFTYDDATSGHFGIGRIASMTDPTGSVSYTYERRGLVKTEARTISGNAYSLAYGYDHDANKNSVTYPDGKVLTYTFDWADRPVSAVVGASTIVSSAAYAPYGPLTSLVYGNGTTRTVAYDLRYRPMENKLVNSMSTVLADYLYAEDALGNISQIHDNLNAGYNRDFSHDDLNRLTTANSGSSLWGTATGNGYSYDSMGNLKSIQLGSGRTASFAYSGTLPKLSSVTENGTNRPVGYDAAGNETTVGSATYSYTPRNQLASGDGFSYTYDGLARRTVSVGSVGTRYSFYGPELDMLSESAITISGKPSIADDYIWFSGLPVAQIDTSSTRYTFDDHLGTPLIQTDSTQAITWQAEYEPYGEVWTRRANDLHQPLRLPGQVAEQFDTGANGATERSYNMLRWYRPNWGRYSQGDPIGLANGPNLYAYAGDNPSGVADPLGLSNYIAIRKAGLVPPQLGAGHVYWIVDPFDILKRLPGYKGECIKTIAGEPGLPQGTGPLVSAPNDPEDKSGIYFGKTYVAPPANMSDNDLSSALLTADYNYRQHANEPNYAGEAGLGLAYIDPNNFNSNGYIYGMGIAVGLNRAKLDDIFEGFSKETGLYPFRYQTPVPADFFDPVSTPSEQPPFRFPKGCACLGR